MDCLPRTRVVHADSAWSSADSRKGRHLIHARSDTSCAYSFPFCRKRAENDKRRSVVGTPLLRDLAASLQSSPRCAREYRHCAPLFLRATGPVCRPARVNGGLVIYNSLACRSCKQDQYRNSGKRRQRQCVASVVPRACGPFPRGLETMGRTRIDIGRRNLFYRFGATRRGLLVEATAAVAGGASKALVCRSRVETQLDDWVASSLHEGPKPKPAGRWWCEFASPSPRRRRATRSSFFSSSSGFLFDVRTLMTSPIRLERFLRVP